MCRARGCAELRDLSACSAIGYADSRDRLTCRAWGRHRVRVFIPRCDGSRLRPADPSAPTPLDGDGTVFSTGRQTNGAHRIFNPLTDNDPSHDPILVHVAEIGRILRRKNRPGSASRWEARRVIHRGCRSADPASSGHQDSDAVPLRVSSGHEVRPSAPHGLLPQEGVPSIEAPNCAVKGVRLLIDQV